MDQRISAQLQKLEKEQKARIVAFEDQMMKKLSPMLTAATEKFQTSVQQKIQHVNQNMESLQKTILEKISNLQSSFNIPTPPYEVNAPYVPSNLPNSFVHPPGTAMYTESPIYPAPMTVAYSTPQGGSTP